MQPSEDDTSANRFKPGHWGVGSVRARANHDDIRGELVSRSVSADGVPLSVDESGVGVIVRRPLILPKGQAKYLETRFLLPRKKSVDERRPVLENRLLASGTEIEGGSGSDPIADMQPQEYLFTVLSNRTDVWNFLTAADWTELTNEDGFEDNRIRWLSVVRPSGKDLQYLPETMLAWTATSVLLWDDLRPDQLTPEVQRAIVDWIHWGGRLIVNGPTATGQFVGEPWQSMMPLENLKLSELPDDALSELVKNWTIPGDESGAELARKVSTLGSLAGALGDPVDDAVEVEGTHGLVWRKRVGRGSVTISKFDLSSGWLSQWRSASGFLNGAVLNLPHRRWESDSGQLLLASNYHQLERDPRVTTNLRLFSRDAGMGLGLGKVDDPQIGWNLGRAGSLGEWSDNSAPVNSAMDQLRAASGITIPKREFVLRSIGIYLLVLIPVNFLVFWVFRRVEFAWLFAPLMAVFGAAWVTRSAQLDIGFARSLNELSIIELQPDHSRGHLTRVLAIYNSLSTVYSVESKSNETLLGPASSIDGVERSREAVDFIQLSYGFGEGMQASGLSVPSNRTLMFRSEEMFDLEGPLGLKNNQLINSTHLNLEDVAVWENRGGELRVAVVGPLAAGGETVLQFRDASDFKGWEESELGASELITALSQMGNLADGASRLIGRVDGSLPGTTVSPMANQSHAQTIVLANLKYGALPATIRDASIRPRSGKKELNDFDFEQLP